MVPPVGREIGAGPTDEFVVMNSLALVMLIPAETSVIRPEPEDPVISMVTDVSEREDDVCRSVTNVRGRRE